jgi:hypothetical protein
MTAIKLPHGTSVPAETSTISPQVAIKTRELQATKTPTINNKILINSL